MAYLASTEAGRRVNLSRLATDADFVLAVGVIARDPSIGWSGPWWVDLPRPVGSQKPGGATHPAWARGPMRLLGESAEVGWLLGNQFQVGVVPGDDGAAQVFAGLGESVRAAAVRVGGGRLDVPGRSPGRPRGCGDEPEGGSGRDLGGPGDRREARARGAARSSPCRMPRGRSGPRRVSSSITRRGAHRPPSAAPSPNPITRPPANWPMLSTGPTFTS